MKLTTILFLPVLVSASSLLSKRCRIGYSIQPCWVRWDHSECEAYVPRGVTYSFDEPNHQITITGLCESCSRALAREDTLKRTDTWAAAFGKVEDRGNGTFVISYDKESFRELNNMKFLQGLRPHPQEWGTSCVWIEGDPEPGYE
ncbi:hypothetical protein B0T16DRAFT_328352 [Cercophora newfieldiana]|uniref:Uncharacterized protein n=1 Tax=Cercophora newfieldiana TaxID=92897 RepID=A0AA40CQ96_9PEZI|nr:hypothetical protein B0T16DRAFT_328352 [Cercophora newfieldiana]